MMLSCLTTSRKKVQTRGIRDPIYRIFVEAPQPEPWSRHQSRLAGIRTRRHDGGYGRREMDTGDGQVRVYGSSSRVRTANIRRGKPRGVSRAGIANPFKGRDGMAEFVARGETGPLLATAATTPRHIHSWYDPDGLTSPQLMGQRCFGSVRASKCPALERARISTYIIA